MGENENIVKLNYNETETQDKIVKGAKKNTETTTRQPEKTPEEIDEYVKGLEDKYTNLFGKTYTEPKKPYKELADEKMKQKASLLMDSIRLITDIASVAQGGNAWKRNDNTIADSQKRVNQLEDAFKRELEKYREGGYNAALKDQNYKDNLVNALLKREITTKTETEEQEADKVVELKTTKTGYKQEQKKNNPSNRSGSGVNEDGGLDVNVMQQGGTSQVVTIPKENIGTFVQEMFQKAEKNQRYKEWLIEKLGENGLTTSNYSDIVESKGQLNSSQLNALAGIIGGQMPQEIYDTLKEKSGSGDFDYNLWQYRPDSRTEGSMEGEKGFSQGGYKYKEMSGKEGVVRPNGTRTFMVYTKGSDGKYGTGIVMTEAAVYNMNREYDESDWWGKDVRKDIIIEEIETPSQPTTQPQGQTAKFNAKPR